MCKPAIPALDRQVPAPYTDIMGTGEMAIPASSILNQFPDRIFPKSGKRTGLHNIFYPGNKDPRRPTVIAYHLSPVGNRSYELVSHLTAMIAVGPVPRRDEMVVHGELLHGSGSLT
jgi:hypothetical protein